MKKAMKNFLHIRKTWKDDKEKIEKLEKIDELLSYNTKFIKISSDCPTVYNFR